MVRPLYSKYKEAEIDKELYDELEKYNIPITIVNKRAVYTHEEYDSFRKY